MYSEICLMCLFMVHVEQVIYDYYWMLGTLAAVPSGQCSVGTSTVYQLITRQKTSCALDSLNIWKEHKLVLCSHDLSTTQLYLLLHLQVQANFKSLSKRLTVIKDGLKDDI